MLQTANVASGIDEEGAAVYINIKSVSIILFITVKVYVVLTGFTVDDLIIITDVLTFIRCGNLICNISS